MRICFVAHQATKEGAGRFLLDEAEYLRQHDFEVAVVLPAEGALLEALSSRSIQCHVIPFDWWWIRPSGAEPDRVAILAAARRIAEYARGWHADAIYTHTVVAVAGPLAAALAGLPHIWHLHEFAYHPDSIRIALDKPAMARLLDQTSNFIFLNSQTLLREWRDELPAEKIRIVRNWVSLPPDDRAVAGPATTRAPQPFVIVMVASIIPTKRQLDAVHAVSRLVSEGRAVRLRLVGPVLSHPYETAVRNAIRQHDLDGHVEWVGYVENPAPLLRAADVSVVCSEVESFGRVTVESMAVGTPVVGANAAGTADILHDGVDGLLYPPRDVAALADVLRMLMDDRARHRSVATAARNTALRYCDPHAAMQPAVEALVSLRGARNPSWPLGSTVGEGLAGTVQADKPSSLLGRLRRRLTR